MEPIENVEETIRKKLHVTPDRTLHERVLAQVRQAYEHDEQTTTARWAPAVRRRIMKKRITQLAAAVLVAAALALGIVAMRTSTPVASAADVFNQAANAMSQLTSFHVRVEMRTPPGDNFAVIGLAYDFVPIDFWRQYTDTPPGSKWRLEEPGRVVVMDGQRSTMLIKYNNYIHQVNDLNPERYWKECLVELEKVMSRESEAATGRPRGFTVLHERGDDGRDKIFVTAEAQANIPETDYLRNKYIHYSDHAKVYQFDAETKLLEHLEIYVHDGDRDVLVFRLVEAEYNVELDAELFRLEVPEDAIYSIPLEVLPDNERYEAMTPKEAATAFFTACAEEDWEELLKFMGQTRISQRFKDYLGGLEIVEIGEPFQSGDYPGWFIPYQIRLKSGQVKQHNLALRKDNQANRFELDGGI
ncbi:MAG: hypothetical protein JSW27_04720 [Phycisphaerales bacterium]|nr:MAG: hypothetical protein JSW27_04720 [Phycisphaerales bacterium]